VVWHQHGRQVRDKTLAWREAKRVVTLLAMRSESTLRRRLHVRVTAALVLVMAGVSVAGWHETNASGSAIPSFGPGKCSKSTAVEVATRLHVGVDPILGKTPISQVLCGPFLGPGSQGMVASVAVPTGCGGSLEWAVFRFTSGNWQVVMVRKNGAFLSPVGSNIREKVGAPRSGDPHCSPSAWKSRIWHWNGSRFVASPWKVTSSSKSGPKTVHLFYVRSPSHNLWCDVGDEGKAYCVSKDLPHSATLALDGTLRICNGRRCVANNNLFKAGTPVLAYGQRDEQGGYRCKSEQSGISCTVILAGKGYAKGFLINGAGVRRVGS
jgi:hypothetical protein